MRMESFWGFDALQWFQVSDMTGTSGERYVPMVEEVKKALKLAPRNLLQPDGGVVRLPDARARHESSLEEVAEERGVAL